MLSIIPLFSLTIKHEGFIADWGNFFFLPQKKPVLKEKRTCSFVSGWVSRFLFFAQKG